MSSGLIISAQRQPANDFSRSFRADPHPILRHEFYDFALRVLSLTPPALT